MADAAVYYLGDDLMFFCESSVNIIIIFIYFPLYFLKTSNCAGKLIYNEQWEM